jgi:hypothetical protein
MGGGASRFEVPPTDEEFERKIKATGQDGYLLFRQRVEDMNAKTFAQLAAAAVPSSKYTLFLKYEQQYLAEEKAVLSAMASGGGSATPSDNPLADEARAMLTQLDLQTTDSKLLLDDEWWCFCAKNAINTRNELRFYDSHEEGEHHQLLAQTLWLFEEDARSRALDLSGVDDRSRLQPIASPDNFYKTDPVFKDPRQVRRRALYAVAIDTTKNLAMRNGTYAGVLMRDPIWSQATDLAVQSTYRMYVLLDQSGVPEAARDKFIREHSVFYKLTKSMRQHDKAVNDRTQQLVAEFNHPSMPKYLVAKKKQTRVGKVRAFLHGLLPKGQRDPNGPTPMTQLAEEVAKIYDLKVTATELLEDDQWTTAARDLLDTTDQLLDYLGSFGIPATLLAELQDLVVEMYEAEERANERALEMDKPQEPEEEDPTTPEELFEALGLPPRRPGSYYLNKRRSTGGTSSSSGSAPTSPISARDAPESDSFVAQMASNLGLSAADLHKDKTWMRLAAQYLESVKAYPFKGTPAAKKMELKRLRHLFTLLAQRANRKDMLVIIF